MQMILKNDKIRIKEVSISTLISSFSKPHPVVFPRVENQNSSLNSSMIFKIRKLNYL